MSSVLIRWYRKHCIAYPWRQTRDPYAVWVSEILLQQTRVSAAIPFYERIIARFPSVRDLASANPSEFLALWTGIGYYRRAEDMLRCAREIEQTHGGKFPHEMTSLLALPGIGKYTAGALRNLCFRRLTPAIDGNIARVLARISGCNLRQGGREFRERMEELFLLHGKGAETADYFQGLMELGERICKPAPDCPSCPLRMSCLAFQKGNQGAIPVMPAKKKPSSFHWYFLLVARADRYFYVQNPRRDFLKKAWLFPDLLTEKRMDMKQLRKEFQRRWNINLRSLREAGTIKHSVTFRKITGHLLAGEIRGEMPQGGSWLDRTEMSHHHTSSVARKILQRKLLAEHS